MFSIISFLNTMHSSMLYGALPFVLSACLSINPYLNYCISAVNPWTFLFFKIALAVLSPLHVHKNFRISLSIPYSPQKILKNCWDFDWAHIESTGRTKNLTILSLRLHEHGISLPRLSFSSLISLYNFSSFQYRGLAHLFFHWFGFLMFCFYQKWWVFFQFHF